MKPVAKTTAEEADLVEKSLNARGLQCPLPILKTKRALRSVSIGGLLEVMATDPGSPDDFVAFCESTGNELIESRAIGDGFRFVIRRLS